MTGKWIEKKGASKLLVFFLGWSCDENMLSTFTINGYDIYAIFDYTNMDSEQLFCQVDFDSYSQTDIVAWSFGVWAASHVGNQIPNLGTKLAMNGTPHAVDNKYGIPARSFKVTCWAIGTLGLEKFNERMVGQYKDEFIPSQRLLEDQVAELTAIATHTKEMDAGGLVWDFAVVGSNDNIIPCENMSRYWQHVGVKVIDTNMEHYPLTKEGRNIITKVLHGEYDR